MYFVGSHNANTWTDPEREQGGGPDPTTKNRKTIGFLNNTGPAHLKNPTFNVWPSSVASKTPFQWRFAGGPMMVQF